MRRDREEEREVLAHFETEAAITSVVKPLPYEARMRELNALIGTTKDRLHKAREDVNRYETELWRLVTLRTQIEMECPACRVISEEGGYTSTLGVQHTYRGGCLHAG